MYIRWISVAFTVAAALALAAPADAQVADLIRSRYSPAAYYNYGEPGDVTILVSVWGTVRNPGLYEVPSQTTLTTLFSLAGGPLATVRQKQNKRWINARLTRGRSQDIVFETTMENEILSLETDPALQSGDVLTVETVERAGVSWRDVFPVIAAVASVALAAERVLR
jgi:protein involved in polysaccharide export with SLBB domain